jgi:O-glycosyl hydrolase
MMFLKSVNDQLPYPSLENKRKTRLCLEVLEDRTCPSLVAAFGLNEGSGGGVTDASGMGNHGVIAQATWANAGKYGKALSFNGTNSWVTIPDANSLDLTTGMTLEAWVNPSALNSWETVLLKETGNELSYAVYADNNGNDSGGPRRPAVWVRQAGTSYSTSGTAQLPLNQWTHLAATYDGSALRLYVNGVLASTLARSGPIDTSTGVLRIGGNAVWGEYFNGLIDEVRVYDNALSQSQIQTDMNTPIGLIASEGFGYSAWVGTYEPIDLVSSNPGVLVVLPRGGNDTQMLTLPDTNTFNFYGTSYSSLFVSSNGLITFDSQNGSAANSDLSSLPTQRALAPLWDDWHYVPGQRMILGKYEDLNADGNSDRLILEWNNVQGAPSSPSTVTFQAILQLNTGTRPGEFVFNYPDLNSGDSRSDGGSATIGIKDAGTQGSRRLLVSMNSASSPYVGSSKAIRFTPDAIPPTVTVTSPANGATVSGTVFINAAAADNFSIAGVQFKLNGANLGAEDATAPYSIPWNTTLVANGTHQLTAVARDTAGNVTNSAVVTVTVNNTGGGDGVTLTINGAQQFQRMDGFGVNANVNSWDGGTLHPAINLLADDLGASLWRVYIDNTDWETTNDNADAFVFNWSYYNQLYATPRFEEAWALLDELNNHGISDGIVLNFMGPGPSWMGGSVLSTAQEDEWVEMILSYVYYARFNREITFYRVAPFNEPDWNGLEGITADQFQLTRVLAKMATRLDALGMSDVRLVGPETASASAGTQQYIPEMLDNPTVMAKVEDFAIHNYAGNSAGAGALIAGSSYPDRGYWISEQSFGNSDLSAIDNLMNHLEDGASATLVFKAYDGQDNHHPPGEDFSLGLLQYHSASQTYTPRQGYHVIKQVHKFVRPGMFRIAATDSSSSLRIFAFHNPSFGQLTILGRNTSGNAQTVNGSLTSVPGVTGFQMYYSTNTVPFEQLSDVTVTNGVFAFSAPPNSVFTLTYAGSQGMLAAGTPSPLASSGTNVSESALRRIRNMAILHWAAQGVSRELLNVLRTATIAFADLPDRLLGTVSGNRIILDHNAAGFGWFVDSTPHDRREFSSRHTPARVRMDLLSVVSHEFGHLIGLGHSDAKGTLMSDTLKVGTRPLDLLTHRSDKSHAQRTVARLADHWGVGVVRHARR